MVQGADATTSLKGAADVLSGAGRRVRATKRKLRSLRSYVKRMGGADAEAATEKAEEKVEDAVDATEKAEEKVEDAVDATEKAEGKADDVADESSSDEEGGRRRRRRRKGTRKTKRSKSRRHRKSLFGLKF